MDVGIIGPAGCMFCLCCVINTVRQQKPKQGEEAVPKPGACPFFIRNSLWSRLNIYDLNCQNRQDPRSPPANQSINLQSAAHLSSNARAACGTAGEKIPCSAERGEEAVFVNLRELPAIFRFSSSSREAVCVAAFDEGNVPTNGVWVQVHCYRSPSRRTTSSHIITDLLHRSRLIHSSSREITATLQTTMKFLSSSSLVLLLTGATAVESFSLQTSPRSTSLLSALKAPKSTDEMLSHDGETSSMYDEHVQKTYG